MADETAPKVSETEKTDVAPAAVKAEAKPAKPEAATEAKAEAADVKPAAKAATADVKPAPKAAKAKPARKPARRVKAAKPARKPAKVVAKKPVRKPAAKKINKTRPARAGANAIEGVTIMTNKNNEAGLYAAEQFKTVFGDVNERARTTVERSAKIVEEFADLTRGNVEAFVASSKIAAKGVETLGQDAAEYSRKAFEEASATLKSFAEVKSATDLFKLQSDFARAAFDSAVAESARLSETVLKIAGDVAEPINSRYTVAAERVKTLAA